MKILNFISKNILFIFVLFLLIFIPLYPKLPLLDIRHTWVYVRVEDFVVAFAFLLWILLLFTKRITLKTPLTMSILLFWIVGVVATIHGILLILPTLGETFPNLALLNYLRRIEYVGMFFIAFSSIKSKKAIPYTVFVLVITLLLVSLYGIGQKYLGFPAYLTMNEEFAKGIPIQLSRLSRVSSTFGGHYDLAGYLVLVIPLLTSIVFGLRNWFVKIFILATVLLGFVVLFMTVSRVSFFVLFLSLFLVLMFQKRRLAIFAVISLFLIGTIFLSFSSTLLERFGNTLKEVDVLVDATTGDAVGHVKEVPSEHFKDKVIRLKFAQNKLQIDFVINSRKENDELASPSAMIIDYSHLPPTVPLIVEPNSPTGENLPQGTGYINLTLAPVTKRVGRFYYEKSKDKPNPEEVLAVQGNFIIKKVLAYDLSFTTRFQGEWPRAISIFEKDILFGGGYSATGLAVDNNYLRILGEVGLLGFFSYFGIILLALIYMKKILPDVDSPIVKSFVFGFIAGLFGLALNAVLIDVFEASKIAYSLWLLMGITIGTLYLYQNKQINLYSELKKTLTSTYAIIIYLFVAIAIAFSVVTNYYFVADDFTWLKWAANCQNNISGLHQCKSVVSTIFNYFTQADGFFYRPGTKSYFLLMYSGFWLNQTIYHMASILLHFIVAMLLFLISKKILKNFFLSAFAAFLFIILSGYSETIFWVSATGHIISTIFILGSLLLYTLWRDRNNRIYFILSLISIFISLLFYELGVVAPLLIILYGFVSEDRFSFKGIFKKSHYLTLFSPVFIYLILRFLAHSHWFSGDYSYNLLKLPFNFVGNILGYLMLNFFGTMSLPIYQSIRNFSKENAIIASLTSIVVILIVAMAYKKIIKKMNRDDQRIIVFGAMFFIISLLPFLGFGNITPRYSYLSTVGFIILFVFSLKKIYERMNSINGRNISIACMVIIIGIFSLVHVVQLQKNQVDWREAGEKSRRFLISLDGVYTDYWAKERMNFYFVNVPIRNGDAWVFPVGLKDAVWFVFRNDNINVYQLSSEEEALNGIKDITRDKVFVFNDDGSVTEKKSPKLLLP